MDKITKILTFIKRNRKLQYIIVGLLIGILLIYLFFNFSSPERMDNDIEDNLALRYVESLEERLENSLSKVKGAGKVSVVITVSSGMETVLASTVTTSEDENGLKKVETPIVINGKTVTIKEEYPKITGVLIVAQGASNISVLNNIQQATVSLLNIKSNQVEILTMK